MGKMQHAGRLRPSRASRAARDVCHKYNQNAPAKKKIYFSKNY